MSGTLDACFSVLRLNEATVACEGGGRGGVSQEPVRISVATRVRLHSLSYCFSGASLEIMLVRFAC